MRLRNLAATTTLATAATLLLVAQAVAITVSWGLPYWPLGCATGIAVCAAALLTTWPGRRGRGTEATAGRGRVPVVATVGAMVVAGVTMVIAHLARLPTEPAPATILGLAVVVAVAVRRWTPIPAATVAAGGLAIVVASRLLVLPTSSEVIPNLAATGWLIAVAVGLALRLRDARRRGAAETVRREERLELARELHDVVAHHITGIVVQAQAAQLVGRSRPEMLDGTLAGIEEAGAEALAAMRRVVGLLRDTDDVVTTSPTAQGVDQLTELVRRFEGHGPEIELRLPEERVPWPPEVSTTVYRVVQESLTNIARHASHARCAVVDIAQNPADVTISITDDAPTGHVRSRHLQKGGFGLIGMRERVEALGGTLTVGPKASVGWSVLATVPVLAKESR